MSNSALDDSRHTFPESRLTIISLKTRNNTVWVECYKLYKLAEKKLLSILFLSKKLQKLTKYDLKKII